MLQGAAWSGLLHTAYHSGLLLWLPLRELPRALRIDMLIVSNLRLISLLYLYYISLLCGFIAYTLAKLYLFYRIFCFCGSVYERRS